MGTKERAVLVGIVIAVAIALRAGFVAMGQVQSPLRADAGQYAQYAANVLSHGVYSLQTTAAPLPDSFRSPGYPLFLAVCRLVGGEAGWMKVAIALQVALGGLCVLFVQRLAQRVWGFGVGLVAAVLTALSPHLVVSSGYVLTECLTTAVVVAAFWAVTGAERRPRLLVAALLFGFAVLCNEALVVLPLAVGFALWRTGRGRALLFALVAIAPLCAWQLRNQSQPLALRGSQRVIASISHGSYPGMVFREPRYFGFPYREDPEQPAFGSSWTDLGRVLGPRVAAEPLRYVAWYALQKPVWLWGWDLVQGRDVCVYEVANSPYERQAVMQATHAAMRWLHLPVMLLGALGVFVAIVRNRRGTAWQRHALGLAVLAGTLAYLPVIPDPRYLQPLRPIVFAFAAASAAAVVARVWRPRGADARAAIEVVPAGEV